MAKHEIISPIALSESKRKKVRTDELRQEPVHGNPAQANQVESSQKYAKKVKIQPTQTVCNQFQSGSKYGEKKRSGDLSSCSVLRQTKKQQNKPKTLISTAKVDKETKDSPTKHTVAVISEDKPRTASQLFSKLFDKDSDGDTILHLTIIHKDQTRSMTLIQLMSEGPLDIFNKLRQTPLHLAVLTCQPEIVKLLVSYGASANARDRNGQTSLHLASKNADVDSVIAIKEGTEKRKRYQGVTCEQPMCDLKNFQGQAAIHLAVLSGSRECVRQLLDMNADVNIQEGTSGRTPLHFATEAHNISMVEFLLQNHANVNASTFSGNTALHTAHGCKMDQIVQILMRHGADITCSNIEGDTPFYVKTSRRKSKK